ELPHKVSRQAWLAIRVGTRLAGSVGLIPGDPWSRLGHSASLFVYLHTAWWGRGLAARGLRACIEEARRRGIVRLEVLVVDENERSRRLFLRNGFRVEGVRRCGFRGDDGFHDLLSLALVLDPPEPGPHPTGED
ncbi:MAG TPA: GNAT family protein, partial [Methanoregulaceae archaeon]|nr:GNAT family protein [Methanoregulaceae archaeon]